MFSNWFLIHFSIYVLRNSAPTCRQHEASHHNTRDCQFDKIWSSRLYLQYSHDSWIQTHYIQYTKCTWRVEYILVFYERLLTKKSTFQWYLKGAANRILLTDFKSTTVQKSHVTALFSFEKIDYFVFEIN